MSNGKGMTPRRGYNYKKYAANYDRIFGRVRPVRDAAGTSPAAPRDGHATITPATHAMAATPPAVHDGKDWA